MSKRDVLVQGIQREVVPQTTVTPSWHVISHVCSIQYDLPAFIVPLQQQFIKASRSSRCCTTPAAADRAGLCWQQQQQHQQQQQQQGCRRWAWGVLAAAAAAAAAAAVCQGVVGTSTCRHVYCSTLLVLQFVRSRCC
jgi:hypothetical protein